MASKNHTRLSHPTKRTLIPGWHSALKRKKNNLSKRMLYYILLCSTSFALLITLFQLAWDYQKDVSLVEQNIHQIEASYLRPIAASLWALDEAQVQTQIEGIMKLPNIQYVRINEFIENKEVTMVASGQISKRYDLHKEFDLTFQGETIGRLFVAVSLTQVYRRIGEKAILILTSQGIKTLVVSMAILIIIYLLVIRHLKTIVEYTRQLDLDSLDEPLKLDRAAKYNNDELAEMVATFNYMREKVKNEFNAKMMATEQLIKEQAFSTTVINTSNAIITCLDENLNIISSNPAGTSLSGIEQNKIMGQNWLEVYCDFASRQEIKFLLQDLQPLTNQETSFTSPNNITSTLLWSFVPFTETNSPYKLIAFGYDISALKNIELEIKTLNLELEKKVIERTQSLEDSNDQLKVAFKNLKKTQTSLLEAEKMASLGGLVAGVAHEINTPIGISVTAASFLHRKASNIMDKVDKGELNKNDLTTFLRDVAESTELILGNQQRAADLISSFKQVSVDQSSHAKYNFNLQSNIESVITSLSYDIKLAKCQIKLDCDKQLSIHSYPGSFNQIFSNLILNSIAHGFDHWDGERTICIKVQLADEQLVVEYKDTGRGVDEEIAKRIFDPFVTSKRGQGGSGLGTHIVFNLVVQLLKGEIAFETHPDQGVYFKFKLPYAKNKQAEIIIPAD